MPARLTLCCQGSATSLTTLAQATRSTLFPPEPQESLAKLAPPQLQLPYFQQILKQCASPVLTSHFVSISSALLRLFPPLFCENIPCCQRLTHSCAKNPRVGSTHYVNCVHASDPASPHRHVSNSGALCLPHRSFFLLPLFSRRLFFLFSNFCALLQKDGGIPCDMTITTKGEALY
jgi:hypothetical protein